MQTAKITDQEAGIDIPQDIWARGQHLCGELVHNIKEIRASRADLALMQRKNPAPIDDIRRIENTLQVRTVNHKVLIEHFATMCCELSTHLEKVVSS